MAVREHPVRRVDEVGDVNHRRCVPLQPTPQEPLNWPAVWEEFDEVKAATNAAPIRLGLNSVGGDSALRLANCLVFGGTLVSFGAMSMQPLKIPTGLFIFKDLRFRGIWINHWYDNATMAQRMEAFKPLFEMAKRGLLKTKIEKSYSIDEAKAAVAHAMQDKRGGKIVFQFAASS